MALPWFSLLSPPLNSSTNTTNYSSLYIQSKPNIPWTVISNNHQSRRAKVVITNAKADQNKDKEKDKETGPGFNPFGFVTDNPSSRAAIQLQESPAEAGNVGQMLYVSLFFLYIYKLNA